VAAFLIVIIRKKFVAQQLASASGAEEKGGEKFKDNRKGGNRCDCMGDSTVHGPISNRK
jgi:hypothetical protein